VKMMRERTLPEIPKALMKVVHPKCGEFMYGDRGAKHLEGLSLDLEATKGLAQENIFLDMSHKQARQRLLDKPKDDWSSVRINTLMQQLVPIYESATEGKIIVADEFLQSLDMVSKRRLRGVGEPYQRGGLHRYDRERVPQLTLGGDREGLALNTG